MRGKELIRERPTSGYNLFFLWVLLLPLVLILSLRKLCGFLLYGFPKENLCVYCLLWFIVVHVILSDKILISYCLNDKNLTPLFPKREGIWNMSAWGEMGIHFLGVLFWLIELELPSLVYKYMFDILGLGVVFHGSFGWLLIMVVHTFYFPWFPLLGFFLNLHINPDGEWRYLDGLWGLDYHCTW